MKLHYSPGACSIGIHVLLEEIGKPYETALTSTREGAQFRPDFVAINPKSKVPTLIRRDGSVLTEYPAIAFWLARTNPEAKLLPDDPDAQARALRSSASTQMSCWCWCFQRSPARFGALWFSRTGSTPIPRSPCAKSPRPSGRRSR